MSILKHLINGAADMAKLSAASMAQKQAMQQHRRRRRRGGAAENCTPCAAKAKGAEMANTIWK